MMPQAGKVGWSPGSQVTESGVHFTVWAPAVKRVDVVFTDMRCANLHLMPDGSGYHSGHSSAARAGTTFRYRLDDSGAYPDPYSRFQPEGPHGPSMVVNPNSYLWNDSNWPGLNPSSQVVYELHLGTFTAAGTYRAAVEQLESLRDLGVTCVELMPVNEFVGRFGWGYDGVNWFAPYHHYGDPDALRHFVDCAHGVGLGVLMDVVYNHFGADGNYLPRFDRDYFTDEFANPWGSAPNYACPAMRRLAIDNAAYWIREFHIDGLRMDATQSIHDPRHPSLLASIVSEARAAAGSRTIVVSGEDYLQRTPLVAAPEQGGPGLDQLWNDDFHHSSRVALTGNHSGFFQNYRGGPQELLSALRHGFLFQGQYDAWNKTARGCPVRHEAPSAFVVFTQNHDAVANTLYGRRIHELTSAAKCRTMTAVLLLGPQTPLIFMGQEFNASSPFAYFADYDGEVAANLWRSRKKELEGFDQYRDPAAQACVLDPCSVQTVRRSTLDFAERDSHASTYRLFQDLLTLRRGDRVLSKRPHAAFDGAVLSETAFLARWFDASEGDRLLVVNLGPQMDRRALPEPLLAPPPGREWRLSWSSDHPTYGGLGVVCPLQPDGWQFSADCATLLIAVLTDGEADHRN